MKYYVWHCCHNNRRMLKKAAVLTLPAPAHQDAPCPKQGRSERPKIVLPSSPVYFILRGWPGESPTARNVFTRPPTGTPRRAIRPGEGLSVRQTSIQGSGRGCPLLRASNEHSFTVRVLRARRAPGYSLPILLRPRVARAQGTLRATLPPCWRTFSASC